MDSVDSPIVEKYDRVAQNLEGVRGRLEQLLRLRREGRPFSDGKFGALQFEERRLTELREKLQGEVLTVVG